MGDADQFIDREIRRHRRDSDSLPVVVEAQGDRAIRPLPGRARILLYEAVDDQALAVTDGYFLRLAGRCGHGPGVAGDRRVGNRQGVPGAR